MRKAHYRKFSDIDRKISIVRNIIRNLDNGMRKTEAVEEVAVRFKQPISTCFSYYKVYSDELINEPLDYAGNSTVSGNILKTVRVKGSNKQLNKQLMIRFEDCCQRTPCSPILNWRIYRSPSGRRVLKAGKLFEVTPYRHPTGQSSDKYWCAGIALPNALKNDVMYFFTHGSLEYCKNSCELIASKFSEATIKE